MRVERFLLAESWNPHYAALGFDPDAENPLIDAHPIFSHFRVARCIQVSIWDWADRRDRVPGGAQPGGPPSSRPLLFYDTASAYAQHEGLGWRGRSGGLCK